MLSDLIQVNISRENSPLPVSVILTKHQETALYGGLCEVHHIRIRRRRLWKDGCDELRREFDYKKPITVKFIGEPGADGGGPKREFFGRLITQMGEQYSIFEGSSPNCILKHNPLAIQSHEYHLLGKMISLSVLNGGPAPRFLARPVLDYLFTGNASTVNAAISDIVDPDVRGKVLKVCNHSTH